ncbi:MAG TPA: MarR family winged helix-turn-helix transcriptional regulator [Methylocystis sp.]|nr:MarR family winged helix-turn-helix transcriptional regulator [Methylocystis sp.]
MGQHRRSPGGDAVTDLVLDLFRLSNQLVAAGDRLVASLGLTSARWQVLGAIVASDHPQPVAWLARNLGAHRQNVQRIVNDLAKEGLVAFEANPHHRKAQLVILTNKGKQTFDAAMRLQAPWSDRLSEGLSVKDIGTAHRVMLALREKLGARDEGEGAEAGVARRPRDSKEAGV